MTGPTPLLAAVDTKALWYATRGSGTVTLVLLTASLVLGIVTTVGWASSRLPTFVTQGLHRNISLLVTVFLALHVATTVIDGFAPIRWLDAVVPFRSSYRTLWLGLGAVATDLLLALVVTSLVRVHLGFRTWRAVHWLSYACWPVAVVHALGTGSDTRATWSLGAVGVCSAAVLASIWWRLAVRRPERPLAGVAALTSSVVVPLAVVGWMIAGPLQSTWGQSKRSAAVEAAAAGFTDTFTGAYRQSSQTPGQPVTVEVSGSLAGHPGLVLTISLQGRLTTTGGVALQTGDAFLDASDGAAGWEGAVSGLDGNRIDALLADASGRKLALTLTVTINRSTLTAQGSVVANAV
ncbi:MAG: methionine sulfoxide reductase heme-binding subunit [Acidimicrobiia bacterium]|nr:methionine sulfoxide reductase heme-binding subunit [Acidimicrobiia bacterium]